MKIDFGAECPPPTVVRSGTVLTEREAREFLAELAAAVRSPGPAPLIVDLTQAASADWAVLGKVGAAFRRCRDCGVGFGVVCPPGEVRGMLARSKADKSMDVAACAGDLKCCRDVLPSRGGSAPAGPGPVPADLTADIEARLLVPDGPVVPVAAVLSFSAAVPYEIACGFHVGLDEPVRWVFARDLLRAGLDRETGDGDVTVWPEDRETLGLRLTSPFGSARFDLRARRVRAFLDDTYGLVPEGAESGAAAAEIDGLLAPGGLLHDGGGA